MQILVGEDEPISRALLESLLGSWGHTILCARDGASAWETFCGTPGIRVAILDWMMPGLDGVEVCRRIRAMGGDYVYIILLTAKDQSQDVVTAFEAGVDDYITKPFEATELQARLRSGLRIVDLLSHVRRLQGLIPLCMYCHKVRTDQQTWQRIDAYLTEHADALITHSICQDCVEAQFPAE